MKVAPESFRGTQEELNSLRDKAISVGQEVARSSVDIINSTSSALQAGFKNIDGAMEYAKQVNLYANVAVIYAAYIRKEYRKLIELLEHPKAN